MAEPIVIKIIGDSAAFEKAIGSSINNIAAFSAKMLGLGSVGMVLKSITEAAIDHEKAVTKLASAVKGLKTGTEDGFISLTQYSEYMSKNSARSSTELTSALTDLVFATGSTDKAQKALGVTIDFARAKNLSLEQAAKLVGRGVEGNTAAFTRYGVVLDKHATSQDVLNELTRKFGGAEGAYLQTTAGALDRAKNSFNQASIEIGDHFLPFITAAAHQVVKFFQAWDYIQMEGVRNKIDDINKSLEYHTSQLNAVKKSQGENSVAYATYNDLVEKDKNNLAAATQQLQNMNQAQININKSLYENVNATGQDATGVSKLKSAWESYYESLEKNANIIDKTVQKTELAKIAVSGLESAFTGLGQNLGKGEWKAAASSFLTGMVGMLIDAAEIGIKADLALNIAKSFNPIGGQLFYGAVAADTVELAGLETLRGLSGKIVSGGAANGLYNDTGESMVSTFQPREVVIPQRFSDLIASGKIAITGGGSNQSITGDMNVTINGYNKSPHEILTELKTYVKTNRGDRLVKSNGAINL